MPASDNEDEFDALPDDFAGVDFNAIPALAASAAPVTLIHTTNIINRPTTSPTQQNWSPTSSEYEYDELDFAELDAFEARAMNESASAGSSSTGLLAHYPTTNPNLNANPNISRYTAASHAGAQNQTPSSSYSLGPGDKPMAQTLQKRVCPSVCSVSPAKKGKVNTGPDQVYRQMLGALEEEVICPICCDIFVAAHVGNPCGHSYCAECANEWVSKNKRHPTCAVCRARLSISKPLTPNLVADSVVRKYIDILAINGDVQWQLGGSKLNEWNSRKDKWKKKENEIMAQGPQPNNRRRRRTPIVVPPPGPPPPPHVDARFFGAANYVPAGPPWMIPGGPSYEEEDVYDPEIRNGHPAFQRPMRTEDTRRGSIYFPGLSRQ